VTCTGRLIGQQAHEVVMLDHQQPSSGRLRLRNLPSGKLCRARPVRWNPGLGPILIAGSAPRQHYLWWASWRGAAKCLRSEMLFQRETGTIPLGTRHRPPDSTEALPITRTLLLFLALDPRLRR